MCGILAVCLADPTECASSLLAEGLTVLQHRGQDAAGIITCGPRGRLYQRKGNGMVSDVFRHEASLSDLLGCMGISHVRYPTAGTFANSEAQPFYVNSPYGLSLAHNGNLVNAPALKKFLDAVEHRHINTDSDSELLLNVFAAALQKTGKSRTNAEDLFKACQSIYTQCIGAYACVAMIAGFGIIAFRDSHGIRPLVYGRKRSRAGGYDYAFASESVALNFLGFDEFWDVLPGQAVLIERKTEQKDPIIRQVHPVLGYCPDIFEYVYFARPDSVMDGINVHHSRLSMGVSLGKHVIQKLKSMGLSKDDVDVVIPVPDTSRSSALKLANEYGWTYSEGFVKNRYVFRTFIMPEQSKRIKSVRRKLRPMPSEFANKNVLIVDDSIVRGTTSREIVQMAREAGAAKVYFASAAPPVRYGHIYGIDLADDRELVAFDKSEDQVAEIIGADAVIYQSLPSLVEACRSINPNIKQFEDGVFSGIYKTKVPEGYFSHRGEIRGLNATQNAIGVEYNTQNDIALYNQNLY